MFEFAFKVHPSSIITPDYPIPILYLMIFSIGRDLEVTLSIFTDQMSLYYVLVDTADRSRH